MATNYIVWQTRLVPNFGLKLVFLESTKNLDHACLSNYNVSLSLNETFFFFLGGSISILIVGIDGNHREKTLVQGIHKFEGSSFILEIKSCQTNLLTSQIPIYSYSLF